MPRPFLIALGLGAVAVWLVKRTAAKKAAATTATATPPIPNAQGYDYPKTAARKSANVKPAGAPPVDPYPTAQEGQEVVGIAWEDGNYTVAADAVSRNDQGRIMGYGYRESWYDTDELG